MVFDAPGQRAFVMEQIRVNSKVVTLFLVSWEGRAIVCVVHPSFQPRAEGTPGGHETAYADAEPQ